MRFSISGCSFYKLMNRKLLNMPADFGLEIFYEYGSADLWNSLLGELSARGMDGFSIHAPFAFADITADCDETALFDALRRLDELGAEEVYAACPPEDGVGLAVYNRMLRASGFEVVDADEPAG